MKYPRVVFVSYDGKYPCLCSGTLVVRVGGTEYVFEQYTALRSGGGVWFDEEWSEHVDVGPWTVEQWPEEFPKELRAEALIVINDNVPHGCCGGCV